MTLAAAVYHEVDSEPNLVIGAVRAATARNHARSGDTVDAAVVQRVHALTDAASPGDLVTHLHGTPVAERGCNPPIEDHLPITLERDGEVMERVLDMFAIVD